MQNRQTIRKHENGIRHDTRICGLFLSIFIRVNSYFCILHHLHYLEMIGFVLNECSNFVRRAKNVFESMWYVLRQM